MSSGFGNWYENNKEKNALNLSAVFQGEDSEGPSNESNNSGGEESSSMTLPLFLQNNNVPADFGWGSIKSSMEAQMPKKVLGMNYQERFRMFCTLLLLSAVFFGLAFFVGLPMVSIRPQKFALSFTCGSLTFMGSFAILRGPYPHFMSMFVPDRIPFTVTYLASMLATLHFTFHSRGPKGYVLVLTCSGFQLVALLWYLVTFLPGGAAGLQILLATLGKILKPVFIQCAKLNAIIVAKCFGWCLRRNS